MFLEPELIDFLLQNIFWVFLACASVGGLSWTFARAGAMVMEPSQAVLFIKSGAGLYLDVRARDDFLRGHIARAKNIPAGEVEQKSSDIEKYKDKPVMVICQNGIQSRAAAKQLAARGFSNIRVMAGGMAAWAEAQLPMSAKKDKR